MNEANREKTFSILNSQFSITAAVAAGLCWASVAALLLLGDLRAEPGPLAPLRVLFYVAVLLAGALTFLPIERRLALPGLTLEGLGGTALLCYALAFVPPPSGWLFSLPDLPVYLLLLLALFWSVSALAMPLVYALGRALFRARARQLDLRRVRRQAHELGALVTLVGALAALRVLTWVSLLLLLLILLIGELLILSRVEAQ
jgi:hypothetical protein